MNAVLVLCLAACKSNPVEDAYGLDAGPQTPPTQVAAMLPWLGEGHYLSWHCEPEPHPPRPPGAHGSSRICSNDLLAGAGATGAYPIGAASVKELIDGSRVYGFAVQVKMKAESGSDGNGWYWYEEVDGEASAAGTGISGCTHCHSGAGPTFAATARDFVFTQVPP